LAGSRLYAARPELAQIKETVLNGQRAEYLRGRLESSRYPIHDGAANKVKMSNPIAIPLLQALSQNSHQMRDLGPSVFVFSSCTHKLLFQKEEAK
jgi:hypothetical protein